MGLAWYFFFPHQEGVPSLGGTHDAKPINSFEKSWRIKYPWSWKHQVYHVSITISGFRFVWRQAWSGHFDIVPMNDQELHFNVRIESKTQVKSLLKWVKIIRHLSIIQTESGSEFFYLLRWWDVSQCGLWSLIETKDVGNEAEWTDNSRLKKMVRENRDDENDWEKLD